MAREMNGAENHMKPHDAYHHITKSLPLLLVSLVTCAAAQPEARLEVVAVPMIQEYKEAGEIVASIRGLVLTAPKDAWERSLLDAGERSFGRVSLKSTGPLVGMTIVKGNEEGSDALVAQWEPGDAATAGVRSVWLWDTPEYSWFVIQCDPANFASIKSAQSFLDSFLKWRSIVPAYVPLQVQYAPASRLGFLAAYPVMTFAEKGGEYSLHGVTQNSAKYLLIRAGKGWFSTLYPEGGIYVPERFPPLKELAKGWGKERILAETARTWQARGPSTYHYYRDSILITELASRGFTRDDLERLLLAPNPPSWVSRELRAGAVMRALIHSKQLDRNREAFEDVTLRMGSLGGSPLALSAVLGALVRVDSDYSGLAMKCLATCIDQEPPLEYLLLKGSSEEAYTKVEHAAVPARLMALQHRALEQIRGRIEGAKGKAH
jgi:hypothetical protein